MFVRFQAVWTAIDGIMSVRSRSPTTAFVSTVSATRTATLTVPSGWQPTLARNDTERDESH